MILDAANSADTHALSDLPSAVARLIATASIDRGIVNVTLSRGSNDGLFATENIILIYYAHVKRNRASIFIR